MHEEEAKTQGQPDTTATQNIQWGQAGRLAPALVAAVFDVDRTLIPATTTERIFIRYLLRRRVLSVRAVLNTLRVVLKNLRYATPYEAIRRQRAYLSGLPYDMMSAFARRCFETEIRPRLSQAGLEAIRRHKAQGHTIVLLSGSLDFLLRPLADYVGADHLIAARMEVVHGRLTGRILGPYPYGSHKAALIRHFATEHGLDFSQSYCYADHHTDHEVLSLFGNPIVVNPRRRMRQIARRRGWPIRQFN